GEVADYNGAGVIGAGVCGRLSGGRAAVTRQLPAVDPGAAVTVVGEVADHNGAGVIGAGPARGSGEGLGALADLSWPQVGQCATASVLAIPLGATEQHGPHLPLSVDTDIALELCRRICAVRPSVLIAPPLPYGASGEHADFPGTLSIGHEALEHVLVELGRSAALTFARVLFVSGHGGNGTSVRAAVRRLRAEGIEVAFVEPRWSGEPHAGRVETSMLLALDPARVEMGAAAPGDTRPLGELMPALRAHGVRAVSPNGVRGDPRGATADEGRDLLDRVVTDLLAELDPWLGSTAATPAPAPAPGASPAPGAGDAPEANPDGPTSAQYAYQPAGGLIGVLSRRQVVAGGSAEVRRALDQVSGIGHPSGSRVQR
ncbi:MAG: mycofactocin biosynthesis peptidyl-dipeptidase MftE, partial [Sporichthyaceae bacterium]